MFVSSEPEPIATYFVKPEREFQFHKMNEYQFPRTDPFVYLGTRMDKPLATQISQIMEGTAAEIYETELHLQEFSLVFKRIK
jgi:hypothetical protein